MKFRDLTSLSSYQRTCCAWSLVGLHPTITQSDSMATEDTDWGFGLSMKTSPKGVNSSTQINNQINRELFRLIQKLNELSPVGPFSRSPGAPEYTASAEDESEFPESVSISTVKVSEPSGTVEGKISSKGTGMKSEPGGNITM